MLLTPIKYSTVLLTCATVLPIHFFHSLLLFGMTAFSLEKSLPTPFRFHLKPFRSLEKTSYSTYSYSSRLRIQATTTNISPKILSL